MTPVTAPVTGLSLPLSFRPSPSRAGRRGRCCPPGHEHGSVGRFRQATPPRSPRLITEQDTFLLPENPSCPVPGDPHAPQGQLTLSHLQIRLLVRDLPAGGPERRGCSGVWLLPLVPTSAAASGHVVLHLRIRLFFLLGSLARKTSAFKNVLSVSLWTGQSRGLRGRTMKMREAGRRIFVALGSSVRLSGKGARGGCRSPRAPLLTLQVTTAPLPARGPVCLVRAMPPPPLLG